MAVASDNKTIVGVFHSVHEAQAAVRDLEQEGISRNDISIVANKNAVGYDSMDASDKASDVVADAGIGAAIGGVGGLLLSAAGAITIPVIGPILAAGPIAAALTGAGIGAAAGGLIGALTESGVPEEDAKTYAEGVRRGDVLVTVKTHGTNADRVCQVLDRHDAVDVDERVSNWKQRGWSGYSSEAQPFSDEELRHERSHYRRDDKWRNDRYDAGESNLERGFLSTREGAEGMRQGVGSSRDLDGDGDANMLERGVSNVRDTARQATSGRSRDLDGDGDANILERGVSNVRDTARHATSGRSRDLDRDGDANFIERGASNVRDTARESTSGHSRDLDGDGDANFIERGVARVRDAVRGDHHDSEYRRRSRIYDR